MTPCRFCGDPVYGIHEAGDAHPCCVRWIGEWGAKRCVACSESKRARRERRERHDRDHRTTPDPMCEHCRTATGASVDSPVAEQRSKRPDRAAGTTTARKPPAAAQAPVPLGGVA